MSRIFNLFRKKPREAAFLPPKAETPFAVIGDLHGCTTLLDQLLDQLYATDIDTLVLVGDYIDRGEDSAGLLKRLITLKDERGEKAVLLKGNHEDMLLKFLEDPERNGARYLRFGGLQTLASYGIGGVLETTTGEKLIDARDRLQSAMGPDVLSLLSNLKMFYRNGNIGVVHAGADPELPLEIQNPRSLMWGHSEFSKRTRSDGLWIAHGHTIVQEVSIASGRIALDTGAYATGQLSAVYFTTERHQMFKVG